MKYLALWTKRNKNKNPERRKMGCSEKTVPFRDIVLGI